MKSKISQYKFDPNKYVLLPPRPQDILIGKLDTEIIHLKNELKRLLAENKALQADAALGRALRRMKAGMTLWCHAPTEWGFDRDEDESVCVDAPTPDAALIAAGLMEVEK